MRILGRTPAAAAFLFLLTTFVVGSTAALHLAKEARFQELRNAGLLSDVPVITLDPTDVDFAQRVAEVNRPVLLKNSIATNWAALKKWTPLYMEGTLTAAATASAATAAAASTSKTASSLAGPSSTPRPSPVVSDSEPAPNAGLPDALLEDVQSFSSPYFRYWHNEHPLGSLVGIADEFKALTFVRRDDMSPRRLFDSFLTPDGRDAQDGTYNYYAARLDNFGTAFLDIQPVEPMIVKDANYDPKASYKSRRTMCWVGGPGTTTHLHYDLMYNFYTTIYGHKHVVLFPASDAGNLYLYPHLHPGHQQSQVDLLKPDFAAFPKLANARGFEVVMEPGDVLYIPPLWFHHLVSLDLSAAVSVWSTSPHEAIMDSLMRQPLPFRGSWTALRTLLAARVHLKALVQAVLGPDSAAAFFTTLFESRYAPLRGTTPQLFQRTRSFCAADLINLSEERWDDEWATNGLEYWEDVKSQFVFNVDNVFESKESSDAHIVIAKEHFDAIHGEGAVAIWLGHYVEMIALSVVTTPIGLGSFLSDLAYC